MQKARTISRWLPALALLLGLGLFAPAAAAATTQARMPETLYFSADMPLPMWVDASIALDASGHFRPDLFGDHAEALDAALALEAEAECATFATAHVTYAMPPSRDSLEQAVTDSRSRVLGRVTGRSFGFYSAVVPGQLLQVEPVRSFGEGLDEGPYFFFMPVGEFELGDHRICRTDASYSTPPEIGDEVFLFLAGHPVGADEDLLMIYGPGDVVPVRPDDTLALPRQYGDGPAAGDRDRTVRGSASPRSKAELLDRLGRAGGAVSQ